MAKQQQPKVKGDIKRNRLYITLSDDTKKKTLDKIYTEIRFCVTDLQPGFDVITDLSLCSFAHLAATPTLRRIMDYLVTNQAGQVVRILGKKSLLFKQAIRFSTLFQGYSPAYVTTLEEAEHKLEHSARRNGLRFRLHQQQVEYSNKQETGKGYIVDISISGCAVKAATLPTAIGMEVYLTFPFLQEQEVQSLLTISAKVVRSQDDMFAAQFLDLTDDEREKIYQFFVYESRREAPNDKSP